MAAGWARAGWRRAALTATGGGGCAAAALWLLRDERAWPSGSPLEPRIAHAESTRVENWSGTHACQPERIERPRSTEEVLRVMRGLQGASGQRKMRVMGSGLSPNGLAFQDGGLLTLEQMDRVLHVDQDKQQVTVQAGALVGQLLDELKPHGLTLQNLASINQQQVGGFLQVGAHGTGARLPPVEEQIVSMKVASPMLGLVELSESSNPEWFRFAKLGLGCFGVVTEVTLQCVPAHKLVEDTQVLTRAQVLAGHAQRLRDNRHVRYMWIPYEDVAVVVTSNPADPSQAGPQGEAELAAAEEQQAAAKEPLVQLLCRLREASGRPTSRRQVRALRRMGFGELRDALLRAAEGPLDISHVRRVNAAEREFWQRSQQRGVVDDSFNVLAFDCGGQQMVLEVALPCGSQTDPDGRDLEFVLRLLRAIEREGVPAPAPIEQRWTCGSSAAMSPVGNAPGQEALDPRERLFSWVGIIMYLPSPDPRERAETAARFEEYKELLWRVDAAGGFGAATHWAKLELPEGVAATAALQARLAARYPLERFEAVRAKFDPHAALSNELVDVLLRGQPRGA